MLAFGMAMSSNFLFAARGALGKNMMSGAPGQKKLSGADVFALNTVFAFLIMTPVAIYMEGSVIKVGALVAMLESFFRFCRFRVDPGNNRITVVVVGGRSGWLVSLECALVTD